MLGIRLKELRKEYDMNQTELAKRIGVGRTTITEYERETIIPPYDKLNAIAGVFGVSVKYLMGECNSRTEDVDDVQDIVAVLNQIIDQLHTKSISMTIDGQPMKGEVKDMIATQLEQTIKMATYLNR